jgi:hypothetical protein
MYSIDIIKNRQIHYYINLQIYYGGNTRSLKLGRSETTQQF